MPDTEVEADLVVLEDEEVVIVENSLEIVKLKLCFEEVEVIEEVWDVDEELDRLLLSSTLEELEF